MMAARERLEAGRSLAHLEVTAAGAAAVWGGKGHKALGARLARKANNEGS